MSTTLARPSSATRKARPALAKKVARKTPAQAAKPAKPIAGKASAAAAPPAPAPLADKVHKAQLVRDSFTIPADEYAELDRLKQRALKLAHPAKKSEVLRAGIKALVALPDAALLAALTAVPAIKTGRPKTRKADKIDKTEAKKKG
ncbi:MAG: hypothetical protein ABI574_11820 [Burkholderiales bacterium]